jgi:predicted acyltransferase
LADVVCNIGKQKIAELCGNTTTVAPFIYLAIGTGVTAAASTDIQLEAEITTSGGARGVATATIEGALLNTLKLVKTWDFTGSVSVTESGILNASSSGSLLAHSVFSPYNCVNGDSLALTSRVTFS